MKFLPVDVNMHFFSNMHVQKKMHVSTCMLFLHVKMPVNVNMHFFPNMHVQKKCMLTCKKFHVNMKATMSTSFPDVVAVGLLRVLHVGSPTCLAWA